MIQQIKLPKMLCPFKGKSSGSRWLVFYWVVIWNLISFTAAPAQSAEQAPQRIISMAPSMTEILFTLGLGDQVVGVTRYCDYPPSVESITKVGGYVDPNYEEIVALKPDLVVLLTSQRKAELDLETMGLRTLTTPHRTIGDVHRAIRLIGDACGAENRAEKLLAELEERIRLVRRAVQDLKRPNVLICIGRSTDSAQLSGIYIAGRDGFYNEIIRLAGGMNVYRDEQVAFPQISAEGVLQLNPDIIVDLVSQIQPGTETLEEITAQWGQLRRVTAVRESQVHIIAGNYALRPGPRYIKFLEEMARLIHPEAFDEGRDHH